MDRTWRGEERRKEAENGESDERGAVARQNAGAFDACGDDLSKVDRVAEHARSSLESLPQKGEWSVKSLWQRRGLIGQGTERKSAEGKC